MNIFWHNVDTKADQHIRRVLVPTKTGWHKLSNDGGRIFIIEGSTIIMN